MLSNLARTPLPSPFLANSPLQHIDTCKIQTKLAPVSQINTNTLPQMNSMPRWIYGQSPVCYCSCCCCVCPFVAKCVPQGHSDEVSEHGRSIMLCLSNLNASQLQLNFAPSLSYSCLIFVVVSGCFFGCA